MGLGVGIFLTAVGAILKWGVNTQSSDFNIETIGVILMVVGIAGTILSMIFWSSWGGFGARRSTAVYDDRVGYEEERRVSSGYGPDARHEEVVRRRV